MIDESPISDLPQIPITYPNIAISFGSYLVLADRKTVNMGLKVTFWCLLLFTKFLDAV